MPRWVSRNLPLAIGNRARRRLRLSLKGALAALEKEYGRRPDAIRLASVPDTPLKPTSGDRVFLTKTQTSGIGGFNRHGDRVRVQFLYPYRLHVRDQFWLFDNADLSTEIPPELAVVGTSGLGLLVRVEAVTQKRPKDLGVMNSRLQGVLDTSGWLDGFTQGDEGESAEYETEAEEESEERGFLVHVIRQDRNNDRHDSIASGDIDRHGQQWTRFVVHMNDGINGLPSFGGVVTYP